MKSTASKNSQPAAVSPKPFFNKGGEDSFFSKGSETDSSFFSSSNIQANLAVGAPDDPFEQEAEKVSRQVMDGFDTANSIQRKIVSIGVQPMLIQPMSFGTRISRRLQKNQQAIQAKCTECEKEDQLVQPKSLGIQFSGDGAIVPADIESKIQSKRGSGSGMDAQTKSVMESSFGADFSGVRVHTDSQAVQMSQQLNAHAFTVSNDIFFNQGRYQPSSKGGAGLLAHELTHTVQQGASVQNKRINRQSLMSSLSNHTMAHLSAMNRTESASLNCKEIAQLQKLPEEEMMKVQQLQMLQMKGVDKVDKKRNVGIMRSCGSNGGGGTPAMTQKTVTINITNMFGSSGNASSAITYANTQVYNQANIKLVKGKEENVDQPKSEAILGTDLILAEFSSSANPTTEEKALLKLNQSAGAITLYYVKALDQGSLGENFRPGQGNGLLGVVVGNSGIDNTVSHELGHVLLDDGGHNPDSTFLMHATATSPTKLSPTEITKMRSSPFAK